MSVNGHWMCKDKQLEVEVGTVDNYRKRFLLTNVTPLMDVGTLHKYLVILEDNTSDEKLLSV